MVDGASSIAKRFKVSDLVIGLTIVSFGTSAPEMFVNIIASVQSNSQLAIGNILGSNIANVLLILGVAAAIYPLAVSRGTAWKEIPLSLLAAALVGIVANDQLIDRANSSVISRIDGLVLISFFIIFVYYAFGIARVEGKEKIDVAKYTTARSILMIVGGVIGLTIGGKWLVDSAVSLASLLGVGEAVIGLTIVAIGTSLPELATSAVAAYRRNSDIAVGNVVGSNIFNIFWVLGLSAVINPLPFQLINNPDVLMTIFASLLLFIALFVGQRNVLQKSQGWFFIVFYIIYLAFTVSRN